MKRTLVACTALAFALSLSATLLAWADAPDAKPSAAPVAQKADTTTVVYYMHGSKRCKTCMKIETLTEASVREAFAPALASGEIAWRVVNFEEPAHRHFLEDFELTGSSVVLAELDATGKPMRHEVLPEVWLLTGKEDRFKLYVRTSIERFRTKKS